MYSKLKVLFTFLIALSSFAKINIVTTTTDIAWLAGQVGGEHVQVKSLLNGTENPHFVEALPSFIHKVASADIFCVVGLELEAAWADKVLKRAGNKKVQSGNVGHCDASRTVDVLDKQEVALDRSHGDVHSAGNPHYHLGPSYMAMAAKEILAVLSRTDSKNTKSYTENYNSLVKGLKDLKARELKSLAKVKDLNFMEYHKEFTYFFYDYGLNNLDSVEEISGVPPSAARIIKVVNKIKNKKIKFILATDSAPTKVLNKIVEMTGVKIIISPLSVIDYKSPNAYNKLLDNLIKQILESK